MTWTLMFQYGNVRHRLGAGRVPGHGCWLAVWRFTWRVFPYHTTERYAEKITPKQERRLFRVMR